MLVVTLVLVSLATIVVVAIVTQMVTQCATRCATEACADSGTGGAADLVTDDRAARRTEPTTQSSFGAVAFLGADSTAGCAADTGTNRCACAAADLLADDITQGATQAAADCGSTIAGSQRALRQEKT